MKLLPGLILPAPAAPVTSVVPASKALALTATTSRR